MDVFSEIRVFLKSILSGIILFVTISLFFFICGPKEISIYNHTYLLPLPTSHSFAVVAFQRLQADLLPEGVHLIVTNPLSGFLGEMQVSLIIAFLVLFPFFLYKIIAYLSPALMREEKVLLIKSLIPAVLLFFIGSLFSYIYIIPATFRVLYPFAQSIGATTFFSLEEFTSSVTTLLIINGVMFLLPIFMVLLSYLHIIKPEFWIQKMRHALLSFLIFAAIITPDGTGITMLILLIPLFVLYLLGCVLTRRFKKHNIINV